MRSSVKTSLSLLRGLIYSAETCRLSRASHKIEPLGHVITTLVKRTRTNGPNFWTLLEKGYWLGVGSAVLARSAGHRCYPGAHIYICLHHDDALYRTYCTNHQLIFD